jgi:hypothetical protein
MSSFGVGLLLLCLVIGGLEFALAARGFRPTVVDSAELWSHERARATELGDRALILIGASRTQLDVDLVTLARATGKVPVQLAIDGSSYVPVLADLANDPGITGTIIVDFQGGVPDPTYRDTSNVYVDYAARRRRSTVTVNFVLAESVLARLRQRTMRSYADGTGPFNALVSRVLAPRATPQYLVTLPSRERAADYSKVPMPAFYYQRAARNAGIEDVPRLPDYAALSAFLAGRIQAIPAASTTGRDRNGHLLGQWVERIESRGGSVVFVMYPRSGLVRAADDVRYPRALFWDKIVPIAGGKGIFYADIPALAGFTCPDGSHLDVRDKAAFTRALADALKTRGWIGRGT